MFVCPRVGTLFSAPNMTWTFPTTFSASVLLFLNVYYHLVNHAYAYGKWRECLIFHSNTGTVQVQERQKIVEKICGVNDLGNSKDLQPQCHKGPNVINKVCKEFLIHTVRYHKPPPSILLKEISIIKQNTCYFPVLEADFSFFFGELCSSYRILSFFWLNTCRFQALKCQ